MRLQLLLIGAAIVVAVSPARAGDLNPPAGPVAPTPGPEPRTAINAANTPGDADSTFRITQPGSYYLTGNVAGAAGRHGIEVAADGVTIDLMGFQMLGAGGSLNGVQAATARVVVRNGIVSAWTDGVSLGGADCRVEGVIATANTSDGIVINTRGSVLACSASGNALDGISAGSPSVSILDCVASDNGDEGVSVGSNAVVSRVTAYSNVGAGIAASFNALITGCIARENGDGITAANGAHVADCAVRRNSGDGITLGTGSSVINSNAYDNIGSGITLGMLCTAQGCTAANNESGGMSCDADSTLTNCNASSNVAQGIFVGGNRCRIVACTANQNGITDVNNFSGITLSTSNDCVVEGCFFAGNDIGISGVGTGNTIIRNVARGNVITAYNFAAGNFIGDEVSDPGIAGAMDNISN